VSINKEDRKRRRRLKVYPKYFQRTYRSVIFPEIRLSGKWLKDIGFNCGQSVIVQQEQNKITITIAQPPANRNTAPLKK